MNLSQDEVNALLSEKENEITNGAAEIMTPEMIAAMLDEAAAIQGDEKPAEARTFAPETPEPASVVAPSAAPSPPGTSAPPPSLQQTQTPPPPSPNAGRLVDVQPMQFQAFDNQGVANGVGGIDLVYNIPLQVTVELGKTKKEINEILKFNAGTVIVLDKIAGDPVEIVVNGKLIARGEVVVIDENYGVRITDIVNL